MKKTQVTQYNALARILHWLSAVVIVAMFAVGLWMVDLSYYSEWYKTAPDWHRSVGVLLLLVTLVRLLWKALTAAPPIEGSKLEIVAAKAAHHSIYLLMMVIFISGYLISTSDGRGIEVFGWFTVPSLGELFANQSDIAGTVHFYAAWLLIGLAALHALAALKHHFVNKDNTLRKMIGASK